MILARVCCSGIFKALKKIMPDNTKNTIERPMIALRLIFYQGSSFFQKPILKDLLQYFNIGADPLKIECIEIFAFLDSFVNRIYQHIQISPNILTN